MKLIKIANHLWCGALLLAPLAVTAAAPDAPTNATEIGFTSLFDGQTLNGWKLVGKHGDGYGVMDGVIYCAMGGGVLSRLAEGYSRTRMLRNST